MQKLALQLKLNNYPSHTRLLVVCVSQVQTWAFDVQGEGQELVKAPEGPNKCSIVLEPFFRKHHFLKVCLHP